MKAKPKLKQFTLIFIIVFVTISSVVAWSFYLVDKNKTNLIVMGEFLGDIIINSQADFDDFVLKANARDYEISSPEGGAVSESIKYTFGTVTLNIDVVLSNTITYFSGVFEGNGHTISGGDVRTSYHPNYVGVFESLSGKIRNTRFANCKFEITHSPLSSTKTYCGGVCGYNSGTVENCVVENVTFISNRYKSDCSVGGIVGNNKGTVKNCIVTGNYTIGGNDDNGIFNDDGLYAYYFVAAGTWARYCVFNATMKETGVKSELFHPSENDTSLSGESSNYKSFTEAYNNFPAEIANNISTSSSPWYKYTKTESGGYRGYGKSSSVPVYLRAFIKWKKRYFKVASIDGEIPGFVNVKSLLVPSDYGGIVITANTITTYGITITATAYENYEFANWTSFDSTVNGETTTTHTANFKIKDFTLEFYDDDATMYENSNLGQLKYKYGSNQYTTAEEASFAISKGSLVAVSFLNSHSACAYKTSGDKYVAVKISFYGKLITNNKPETTGRNYEVVFVLTSPDYYIPSAYIEDEVVTSTTTYNASKDLSFFVDYVLRDYSLGII